MPTFAAVFDACVLHSSVLCGLVMRLATRGLFRAKWTDRIHDEWLESALKAQPHLDRERLRRRRKLMDEHAIDCLVTGYEDLIDSLQLPDPDDRHVLAAAIRCGAGVIVTKNLRHFPASALDPYAIEAQHPDEFIVQLLELNEAAVVDAVRAQRAAYQNPPLSAEQLLAAFEKHGLSATVKRLRHHAAEL